MADIKTAIREYTEMGDLDQKFRLGIGSPAAAAAIFAPLGYKGKDILTAICAGKNRAAGYRTSPARRVLGL